MGRKPRPRVPDTRHHDVASDRGGLRAAVMYTLIGTAKLNDIDPAGLARRCPRAGSPTTPSSASLSFFPGTGARRPQPSAETPPEISTRPRASEATRPWSSPNGYGDPIRGSGDDTADARLVASDRRDRNVRSADRAATGSSDARIDRQIAASSIQTGISWTRSAAPSTRPHRADTPAVRSITSRT